jgi:chromate reductase, NAD(P)H dehydrogenase (quinone)
MTPEAKPIRILAISGSLKAGSVNTALLQEMSAFADSSVHYRLYEGLEELPPFNPDHETGNSAVKEFKKQLRESDGLLISTPEYAFGVPGVLKNALDWTVHSGELNDKPVAVLSASPLPTGGDKAMASLRLTLSALGTITKEEMVLSIPAILKKTNGDKRLTDKSTLADLQQLFELLLLNIRQSQAK